MESERVIEVIAEVTGMDVTDITSQTIISAEHCSDFGWRAFHLGFSSFKVGLADEPRTAEEICTWYELAEK